MDNHDHCALISSRRGTYDRKAFRKGSSTSDKESPNNQKVKQQEQCKAHITMQGSASNIDFSPSENSQNAPINPTAVSTASNTSNAPETRSVTAQFEDYMAWQTERNQRQHKPILLGEPSPLTFALEESPQKSSPSLHDASEHIRDSSNLEVIRQDIHPPHLDASDIAYLESKGCFTLPSEPMLNDLFTAYFTRFHPHYSIVNRQDVENCHRGKRLPWILLHTICFIGATFCDLAVIHRSEFASRLDARRYFYHKATALFNVGYDRDKFILLQATIMLSFWGPEMQSYWNSCSWVGFAVTFAISLGIHRSIASSNAPHTHKSLLRRLWWTLVVRDSCCSVLLGRPFQINLSQSDTGMLTADDFAHESPESAFYQTQISKLSKILRGIMHVRLGPANHDLTRETVHTQLDEWHLDFRLSLDQWTGGMSPPFACSTGLELLYHYYIILLYIDSPSFSQPGPIQQDLVYFSARTISSNAITLLTKTTVCALPHELFVGFFVAGIALYRLMEHTEDSVAQMAQASLDNCRVILNEIQEAWGPGHWAMQVFDFLCLNRNENTRSPTDTGDIQQDRSALGHRLDLLGRGSEDRGAFAHLDDNDILLGSNWDPMIREDFTEDMENHLFLPNILPLNADGWSFFQPHTY
jgi:hypothetical protein